MTLDKDRFLTALEDRKQLNLEYRFLIDEKIQHTRISVRKISDGIHLIICVENIDDEVKKEVEMARALQTEKDMARLLLEHNFRVTKIHADAFAGEEKEDFLYLKEHHPSLLLSSPTHPAMRFAGKGGSENRGRTLAIGQGAAYFAGTPFFVNRIADSSLFGFDGIFRLAEEMKKAWETPSLTEQTIQIKGLGCRSCLI